MAQIVRAVALAAFASSSAVTATAGPSAVAASTGPVFCGSCANGGAPPMANVRADILCDDTTATVTAVVFASYGTPAGTCPSFTKGACDATNSSAVVTAACVGQRACSVFPNTSTFGDPCFGTAKVLALALTCSTGVGAVTCTVPPPPPPPTAANFSAAVAVDFARVTAVNKVRPSVQVVSHHFLWRDSPIAAQSWATLKQLGASYVRWVPWLPYAAYGVGQLMPPSPYLCAPQNWATGSQVEPITLDCGALGGTITDVGFASFGQPSGNCGSYAVSPTCHAPNSKQVVSDLCIGKRSCVVPTAAGGPFGTPCSGSLWLAVQATCSSRVPITYWNFTLLDQFASDFWNAVDGDHSEPIPNWSTQPTWLYSPSDYNWNANPDSPWGYSRGAAENCNNTLLGDYYGRLYGYFKNNQMVDEAGATHTRTSGPPLNISIIEVFNEVDYEHDYNPQTYTASFDAVVRGIRKHADPGKTIRFVGLSLPNIDDADKVVAWATHFLNASNHAADVQDARDFIGYHAYPTNGPYTPDPTSFERMFEYVDSFIAGVKRVDAVIDSLSPGTRTVLDETGTDMDGVLSGPNPPDDNRRYWVAAAGYWAYVFARVANESSTVVQVGASQLMDANGQEPSVTLLDWSSGLGTARFWIVRLVVESIALGDQLVFTTAVATGGGVSADAVFAIGVQAPDGTGHRVLLINKRNAFASVVVSCGDGPCNCASARVIDEANGLLPARGVACDATGAIELAPFATADTRPAQPALRPRMPACSCALPGGRAGSR